MKSLEELRAIRERMQSQVSMRAEDHTHTRVVVGMATCGIASGARPVLNALSTLVQEKGLTVKFPLPDRLHRPLPVRAYCRGHGTGANRKSPTSK